jgi:molybdopterin-guanine dinucleotide biosynthesis protein
MTPLRRPSGGLPTCEELLRAPELAILTSLERTLDIAVVTLVAAQPDLQPTATGRDTLSTSAAEAADRVIASAQALASAIAAYRTALPDEKDDLPF